eukprot:CAMPEP_0206162734 /NCGR_PEP_ID=MMETSP1474-20131121/10613_1 /ASSEMBLY_ACC=CAM_ASM_001110 /TAXON_ID=97495 /ORGANISM="Imantonia sp., Strain RCC918" /LENGTH=210 /DNA_ID=CAMNT_0053565089 /DNA_START=144 /DNA_END=772 /DNA_ORIENTATION=-
MDAMRRAQVLCPAAPLPAATPAASESLVRWWRAAGGHGSESTEGTAQKALPARVDLPERRARERPRGEGRGRQSNSVCEATGSGAGFGGAGSSASADAAASSSSSLTLVTAFLIEFSTRSLPIWATTSLEATSLEAASSAGAIVASGTSSFGTGASSAAAAAVAAAAEAAASASALAVVVLWLAARDKLVQGVEQTHAKHSHTASPSARC